MTTTRTYTATVAHAPAQRDGYAATLTVCSGCGPLVNSGGIGDTQEEADRAAEAAGRDHLEAWHRDLEPGDGVTIAYPQDRYGYAVAERKGRTVTLVPLPTAPEDLGGKPAGSTGPWPVWTHRYTPAQIARALESAGPDRGRLYPRRYSLRKDGLWKPVGAAYAGSALRTDAAIHHRDYSN
jgi:hypothetical protein